MSDRRGARYARAFVAVPLASILALSGCSLLEQRPAIPTEQDAAPFDIGAVPDAVEAAYSDALEVTAEKHHDGLTAGVLVLIRIPSTKGPDAQRLEDILVAVWESIAPKPAYVIVNAWTERDGEKGSVGIQGAADRLGIDWTPTYAAAVTVPDYELKRLASE